MNDGLIFFMCLLLFFSSFLLVFATFICGYVIGRYTEIDVFKEIQEVDSERG